MGGHFVLRGVTMLGLSGWGYVPMARDRARIEFCDGGELVVYRTRPELIWPDRKLFSIPITALELSAGTYLARGDASYLITSGFWGDTATPKRPRAREYATLTATETLDNGAVRRAVFGLPRKTESQLRDRLAPALHDWAETWTQATAVGYRARPPGERTRAEVYALADGMHRRGTLTAEQALTLRAEASRPLVDELIVRAHAADAAQATSINDLLEQLLASRRITDRQAADVRAALRPRVRTPPTPALDPHQLELLAELRRTGALTEAEYQAEIARLNSGG